MKQINSITKVSDFEYFKLSEDVYYHLYIEEDEKKTDKQQIKIKVNGKTKVYKIIKTLNNKNNGAQGFAIAPVDSDRKVNTNQIIIAFRGTEFPDDKLDVATDVQQVVQGEKQLKVFDKNEIKLSQYNCVKRVI